MKIRRKHNYRYIELGDSAGDVVGVLKRCGGYRYVRWLGFIDLNAARALRHAIPVKLQVNSFSTEEWIISYDWQELNEGQFIQGCLTDSGVYAVVKDGKPRVIE